MTDTFSEAIKSGDTEHLLWWAGEARALMREIIAAHRDPDAPEYNECDTAKCDWCGRAERLLIPNKCTSP